MSLLTWFSYGVILLTIFFVADLWRRRKNYALFTAHFYNFILSFLLCLTGFFGLVCIGLSIILVPFAL